MSSLSSISGTKLSQHTHTSSPTGTKLSQHTQNCPFQPVLPEQGELCTARTTTPPSRENFVPHPAPNPVQNSPCSAGPPAQPVQNSPCSAGPGAHPVQNSPHTPTPAAHPVQNSPCSAGPSAQPVQNSPNTPKKAHFSQFCPSGENFVPHPPPRPPAGRTLYRSHHHDAQQGELCTAPSTTPGTKLSQHTHTSSPTGTKLSQHAQKRPFQPVLPEQGELCTALTITMPSRENFVPRPAPNPVQNSPCSAGPSAQPVQNSPNTPTPAAQPVQNSPSTPRQQPNRYKTPPTRTVPHPCRE